VTNDEQETRCFAGKESKCGEIGDSFYEFSGRESDSAANGGTGGGLRESWSNCVGEERSA